MRRYLAFITMALLIAVGALGFSDFWKDKPYTKWSEKEVRKMLNDSPWAQSTTLRKPILKQVRRETGQFSDLAGEGEGVADPTIQYTVYIRSAKPIREALVRKAQLDAKYEKMDDAARKQFDEQWSKFLGTKNDDRIIIQVTYSSNIGEIDRQLMNYWQTQTVSTIQNTTAMTMPNGDRVAPVAFWTAKGAGREFQLAFPRPKESSENKAFSVEFVNPDTRVESNSRIFTRFEFKQLTYGGEVAY